MRTVYQSAAVVNNNRQDNPKILQSHSPIVPAYPESYHRIPHQSTAAPSHSSSLPVAADSHNAALRSLYPAAGRSSPLAFAIHSWAASMSMLPCDSPVCRFKFTFHGPYNTRVGIIRQLLFASSLGRPAYRSAHKRCQWLTFKGPTPCWCLTFKGPTCWCCRCQSSRCQASAGTPFASGTDLAWRRGKLVGTIFASSPFFSVAQVGHIGRLLWSNNRRRHRISSFGQLLTTAPERGIFAEA